MVPARAPVPALLLLLAACATTAPPATPATPPSAALALVMGKPAEAALALLGAPTLDRREGNARQLQFARGPCILDLYFVPPAGGGVPLASHADARTADGTTLAPSDCLAQLERMKLTSRPG